MTRSLLIAVAAGLVAAGSAPGAETVVDTRTVGKVVHKGKTLTFAGGACKRPSTPAGTYVATLGVVSTANPARTKSLTITIKRPKGGRTYRNPAAVVSWRISIAGLWVFNPGVVKLSRDLKSGSFSGTVTTGLGQNAGKGSGSWKCGSVT